MTIAKRDRYRGALFGLAVGDAIGAAVEFKQRGTFPRVTDMIGGGPFNLKPGQWTDDTSMALCMAESLISTGMFMPRHIMDKFCRWYDEGYMSSTGKCFDIGCVTRAALSNYRATNNPFSGSPESNSSGNGCIMRLAPIPMFFGYDLTNAIKYSGESSRLTHGSKECLEASRLFGLMIWQALNGAPKESILQGHGWVGNVSKGILGISCADYRDKPESKIKGSGYVVESLEAALWCFDNTYSYSGAVLMAANLGDDADTTAAIVGQLAGAYYGVGDIPTKWMERLAKADLIRTAADGLFDAQSNKSHKSAK